MSSDLPVARVPINEGWTLSVLLDLLRTPSPSGRTDAGPSTGL